MALKVTMAVLKNKVLQGSVLFPKAGPVLAAGCSCGRWSCGALGAAGVGCAGGECLFQGMSGHCLLQVNLSNASRTQGGNSFDDSTLPLIDRNQKTGMCLPLAPVPTVLLPPCGYPEQLTSVPLSPPCSSALSSRQP